jgi:glycerol-3-phosphate acyltransferase PlsX
MEYIIAVDAMGGDDAPASVIEGAKAALDAYPDIALRVYGPKELLRDLEGVERLTVCDAPEVITMHDSPMLAVRSKANSSLVQAMLAVRSGEAGAVVSAGSTGAVLAGGMFRLGRIEGIDRPALTVVLPGRKKPYLLLDCGANVDCQASYLNQFGLMGSVYMQKVLHVESPEVCLLNIGTEAEKGNRLVKEAHQLMMQQNVYRFAGNIEARDTPEGLCDVVVADGFDGNLMLKHNEGLARALMGMLKDEMMASPRCKLGALLLKPAFRAFKLKMSYQEYGGAPLLGVKGSVIKAHGSSDATAIKNAIRQARIMLEGDVAKRIAQGVAALSRKE